MKQDLQPQKTHRTHYSGSTNNTFSLSRKKFTLNSDFKDGEYRMAKTASFTPYYKVFRREQKVVQTAAIDEPSLKEDKC